jgi:ATP-dependent helicase HrpA
VTITYPAGLPISERRDDLLAAIGANQVVIVAGETGSGKSTQLPKFCLELGRGVDGKLIGHTQPRRVAARSIAERVAEELGTELGTTVGYTVRFTDKVGKDTQIKVMTDGILLAEIQRDRNLLRYDTLIIDEAHERSLNVDFLLGYLKQLLPRRPDLKLIITSATIDTARFSAHFNAAPVIEVTGRSYPVEVRFQPLGSVDEDGTTDDRDQVQAICDAVDELTGAGPGDILVFLSGEREIHDAADALRKLERPGLEVLPLYARLSAAEQHRIFEPHRGTRVVLSTNVAETSLTVPGVRYVIDTGTARISRYSLRLKVQRLPIEPVSQASANQRAGRCGRVAPGICIRLYGEEDFANRPLFTEPEILRTNLASVILQMTALGLGDVAAFPFLDPPDVRAIRDGVALLEELGALAAEDSHDDHQTSSRRLTPIGRKLAQLPVDPRLARMVVEADRHGCVRDVLVIASALSIQDPRERPADKQQAADESHARFRVAGSDFLAYVTMWDYLRERQRELSSSQFRKLCRTEFFNYLRVREWQDLYSQLRQVAGGMGIRPGASSDTHPDRVHQSLLAGLLSQLGQRDATAREFRGARNSKFAIVPRSALAKKPPAWVMAGELVETNRLWARVAAAVQPEWAEQLAPHLVKRTYGDPVWDARAGRATTTERVTLYGLPIVTDRRIGYDRVDAAMARTMFIDHALVDGDWNTPHRFVATNRGVLAEVQALAERTRSGTFIGDDSLFAFYDKHLPDDVVSARHFDSWWKKVRGKNSDLFTLTVNDLTDDSMRLNPTDWPDIWQHDDLELAVSYRFDPGQMTDGVTVHVPIEVLNRVRPDGFDWQVPGLRAELVGELLRALPKNARRLLSPLGEAARVANERLDIGCGESLAVALADVASELAGEPVRPSMFDLSSLPSHLRITFSVDDAAGTSLARGYDLRALRRQLSGQLRAAIAETIAADRPSIERRGITSWDFGTLPKMIESSGDGPGVRGYPALLDDGMSVSIKMFSNADVQARLMPLGVRRLLLLTVPVGRSSVAKNLTSAAKLAITRQPTPLIDLVDDCITAAANDLLANLPLPWDADAFAVLVDAARSGLANSASDALRGAARILEAAAAVPAKLDRHVAPAFDASVLDCKRQLAALTGPGFVSRAGLGRLGDVTRYIAAIERRAETMGANIAKDAAAMRSVHAIEARYAQLLAKLPPSQVTDEVRAVRWMIEELRVSLFAQTLGTSGSVSEKRITRVLQDLAP